jgi:hypothetical protein
MKRPSLLVLAASLAAVAVGCAHCDTCDDFPAPCTGPNCGYPYQATFPYADGMNVEPIVSGPIGMSTGQIVSGPVTAPSVVPPAPRPANDSAASDSPPAAPGPNSAAPGNSSADPLDLPLPPAESPFGGPAPN